MQLAGLCSSSEIHSVRNRRERMPLTDWRPQWVATVQLEELGLFWDWIQYQKEILCVDCVHIISIFYTFEWWKWGGIHTRRIHSFTCLVLFSVVFWIIATGPEFVIKKGCVGRWTGMRMQYTFNSSHRTLFETLNPWLWSCGLRAQIYRIYTGCK